MECAPPHCYQSCKLYVQRRDLRCARFYYGIYPNPLYKGLFQYGADIRYRRWGKLESKLHIGTLPIKVVRVLDRVDRILLKFINRASLILKSLSPKRTPNIVYFKIREKILGLLSPEVKDISSQLDSFVMEVWSLNTYVFNLVLELHQEECMKSRLSIPISPGKNFHSIPVKEINLGETDKTGKILIYPENDLQVRVVFTWLDFVEYKNDMVTSSHPGQPAKKVKCVVWDLDNTLWKGTLVENGINGIELNQDVVGLIKSLDERGILQSIASKNDHIAAWEVIEKYNLHDYFLYPAINWGPKSENIRRIAQELNINLDTFAFIDDSKFEREEVKSQLTQVRIFEDKDISRILQLPEFDLPITQESKSRRKSYQIERNRKIAASSYGDNHLDFLKKCQLVSEVFVPVEREHIERCLELIQRSNQLNLSTYRYSENEFNELLNDKNILLLATKCRDRFGNYGLVGFACIKFNDSEWPLLTDFIFSCRVVKKKVENAWFSWLMKKLRTDGYDYLLAKYIQSERNHVLYDVLEEVGFVQVSQDNPQILQLSATNSIPEDTITKVQENDVTLPFARLCPN